jgi:hypothetical protein
MKTQKRKGVSTSLFAGVTILLIVLAAAGFYLYLSRSNYSSTYTQTVYSTSTQTVSSPGVTSTVTVTSTSVSTTTVKLLKSGGFMEGNITTFGYTKDFVCSPSVTAFISNGEATNASKVTTCLVGAGNKSALQGAFPVFVLVPAYAGLSIFGVPQLGATVQGYPVFNGQTIVTQCGAGGTMAACPDHPTFLYSPVFTLVEQHLGIKNGVFGLPEGVLPTPAHDHVVGFTTDQSIPWYVVAVLVFDPNIMPNPITGQCTKVVDSNLTNPTGNCLTSFAALARAMNTKTTATANANATQNNPIYDTLGGVSTQVLIPGVTMISESSPANTNLFIFFNVTPENPLS